MKLRFIAMSLFLGAAVFAQTPPTAAAPARPGPIARFRARRARRAAKALNLTDAQKSQIKSIRQQARSTAQPIASQLRQNRQALNAAIKSNDTAQIQSLSKTQGELRGQIATIRSQTRAQIYAGLTDDQRRIIDNRQARIGQRFNQRPRAN
ncbi:MAG TPA: Spy/CpxP family protein refolding chaperone [Bryobacteraceae bacterium]|nr:Spy/CpxP family protein refolding chaperone [Bryobacteraceae bacterium]